MTSYPIYGFGISGYRSFSGEAQMLGPFKKINIFIGENNSGKSNILRFIRDVYHPIAANPQQFKPISATSAPHGGQNTDILPLLRPASDHHLKTICPELDAREIAAVTTCLGVKDDNCILPFSLSTRKIAVNIEAIAARIDHNLHRDIQRAWSKVTKKGSGDLRAHWIPGIVDWFYRGTQLQPGTFHYVPTLRQIPTKLEEFSGEYGSVATGSTVADELAALSQPDHTRPQDREKFQNIQKFMQSVLKRPELQLSVPHNKSTIIVEDHGRYLPIEALGTGLHQLLILAIKAVLVDNSVICIEEPELHMHPELQHQLMNFIADHTTNQYFITTHSATIMDSVDADVYSVRLEGNFSKVEKPLTRSARRNICHTLGYRPSDLLQANSVIWVEGPTDRMYLLNWLKSICPYLQEGWHFSIMFYGGKLASHLTADESTSDLIELLPINRSPAIIMDSDKKAKGQHVNRTKQRLSAEFESAGGFAWITNGREIENYIPKAVRTNVVSQIAGVAVRLADDDQYGHPLAYAKGQDEIVPDKLECAKSACQTVLDLNVLDLKSQLLKLAQFICKANRIECTPTL